MFIFDQPASFSTRKDRDSFFCSTFLSRVKVIKTLDLTLISRRRNVETFSFQIHSVLFRRLIEVLQSSGSPHFGAFRCLFRDLIEALVEAENLATFLSTLKPIIETIEQTQEIENLAKNFDVLFHTLALIWINSEISNNGKRFVVFLQHWTNFLVFKVKKKERKHFR